MTKNKIILAFENELNLTEQGLIDLADNVSSLAINVQTEEGFKAARKQRTERNKLLGNVKDLAIGAKKQIDDVRGSLTDRIESIYQPIVEPFEEEDARRKEEKKRAEEAEQKRVDGIKQSIESIRGMVGEARGRDSEHISGVIESVDLIDPKVNFDEFTQDAIRVIDETLEELNRMLRDAIHSEKLAKDRAEFDESKKAQERIQKLTMIPSMLMGKDSKTITNQIELLQKNPPKKSEFGELFEMAQSSYEGVISQLMTARKLAEAQDQLQKQEEHEAPLAHHEAPLVQHESKHLVEVVVCRRLVAEDYDQAVNAFKNEFGALAEGFHFFSLTSEKEQDQFRAFCAGN